MTNVPVAPANNRAPALHAELRTELINWCEAWRTCLQNVLSQVSGQPNTFETSFQPLPTSDSDLCYTVTAAGAVHGEMSLRLPVASANRLARRFLGETEPTVAADTPTAEDITADSVTEDSVIADNKEALEELLRQIAGLAATAVAATAGGEVQFRLAPSEAPSWSSDAVVCLGTRDEAG